MAATAIFALSMWACQKDVLGSEKGNKVTLSLKTKPMSAVIMRSGETDETVSNVAIFGVDATDKVIQNFGIMQPTGTNIDLSVIDGVESIYVIANPKGEHTLNYKTVDEIMAERTDASSHATLPLVMAGSVGLDKGQLTTSVDMLRSVAKLTIKEETYDFEVTSVTVTKTPSYTHVFAQGQIPAFEEYVSYPEVEGTVVYVGENNDAEPTRLTVKGIYKNKSVTCNVIMQDKTKANIKVERNTSYTITIEPISETDFDVDIKIDTWDEGMELDNGIFTPSGIYYSVDFHNHTELTDGANRMLFVLNQGKKYGLDILVNSEHGGASGKNSTAVGEWNGKTEFEEGSSSPTWADWVTQTSWDGIRYGTGTGMWRWQTIRDFSWPTIAKYNQTNSATMLVVQGLEWNPPGHEHCSVGVITGQFDGGDNASAQAQFEYMFDLNDADVEGGKAQGWTKSTKKDHEKSMEAAAWLQRYHARTSYMVPAHPERQNKWSISDYRDMNNVAPDVFVAFESAPGHQASKGRGGYSATAYPNEMANIDDVIVDGIEDNKSGLTRGGLGYQSAVVGGLWDAMISEGRHFWLVANSDFHKHVTQNDGDFYPGEYQKTYISMKDRTAQGFVDGLRAGNIYTVHGDLIKELQFSVSSATMGQTLITSNGQVRVKIVVRAPNTTNYNGQNPTLDHIDVIVGEMRDKVQPGTAEYTVAKYAGVEVKKRFAAEVGSADNNGIASEAWVNNGDGVYTMEFDYPITGSTYFRLRGTNQPMGSLELDANGNPQIDPVMGDVQAQAEAAWSDLWFYSNPIFVRKM